MQPQRKPVRAEPKDATLKLRRSTCVRLYEVKRMHGFGSFDETITIMLDNIVTQPNKPEATTEVQATGDQHERP